MYNFRMAYKDLTGMRFGRLIARKQLPPIKPRDGFRWECDCDCGGIAIVKTRLLTYKNGTRSCGCILLEKNRLRPSRPSTNLKHGHTSRGVSPEYICWSSMIQRCTNQNHESFKRYGGRGIFVCQEWIDSFERFLIDMGERPHGKSIDRIDPNGNYTKENCRWATNKEQSENKRNKRIAVAYGVTRTCKEAAEFFGIPVRTIYRWAEAENGDITGKIQELQSKAMPPASI